HLGTPAAVALKVGVGQIVENDLLLQTKEPLLLSPQKFLDTILCAVQRVGPSIQRAQRYPLHPAAKKLAQATAIPYPLPRRALAGRGRQPAYDQERCDPLLLLAQPQFSQ